MCDGNPRVQVQVQGNLHHTRRMLTRAMMFYEFKFRVISLGTYRFMTNRHDQIGLLACKSRGLYCIVLYLSPVLNPMSYDGVRLYKAPNRPMLVIGRD